MRAFRSDAGYSDGPTESGRPTRLHERILLGRQAVLVVGAATCWLLGNQVPHPRAVMALLAGIAIANTLHYWLNTVGRFGAWPVLAQLALDSAVISFLMSSTGGLGSPLVMLYAAEILSGAFNRSTVTTMFATALSWVGLTVTATLSAPHARFPLLLAEAILLGAIGWITLDVIRSLRRTLQFRAASAAHEIKNSLHVVSLLLDEARDLAASGPDARARLEAASAELNGLAQLSHRLYARSARRRRPFVRLATVVEDALALAGPSLRAAGIHFAIEPIDGRWWIRSDPDQLAHALLNLFLNAAHHTPDGGALRVSSRGSQWWFELRVESRRPVGTTPPRCSTSPAERWGLGLQVTREVIEDQGGSLDLQFHSDGACAIIRMRSVRVPWSVRRTSRPRTSLSTPA